MCIIFKFQRRKLFLLLEGCGIKVPRSKETWVSSWYIPRNVMAQCGIYKHWSLSSNIFQRGCSSYYLNHSRLESLWCYISTNICAYLNFSLFDIYICWNPILVLVEGSLYNPVLILYVENTKVATKRKLLKLINEFSKVAGYEINIQNSCVH